MKKKKTIRIGLISDTHMPERCFSFPTTIDPVFAKVDFILHAGDVGELWVLDELSRFAPVFAVHGNDDTADAQRELPLQQVISLAGQRILLWHNHYPDRIDEVTSRTDDLRPKLNRLVQRAKRAGAQIVIFGHWHLPLVYEQDGVTLINPGTIELGNATTRQLIQTVAVLDLFANGTLSVTHVDLAKPDLPFKPHIDFDAGFTTAAAQYTREARSLELLAYSPRLRILMDTLVPETLRMPFFRALNRAAHRVWLDEQETITPQDWIAALESSEEIPAVVRQKLISAIEAGLE